MLMLPTTCWEVSESDSSSGERFARELGIHPLISLILQSRGIATCDDARKFLYPSLGDLHNPFLMKDMDKGVNRTLRAILNNEKIVIYGDYDVDGITSVVCLVKFLGEIGGNVSYYIPHRLTEGYGIHKKSVDVLRERGTTLIISVDCGISDHEAISYAESCGIDTIVLDHHEVPSTIPDASAVINPHQKDCLFPFKQLAGVGVVFNFLIALRGRLRTDGFWKDKSYPNLREYLDLVALGTIGDLVPLIDENRIFAKIGLGVLAECRRPGLQALKSVCGIESNHLIEADTASFSLIPRINASGRVGSPYDALRLLLTENHDEAFRIAALLDSCNRERQEIERAIYEEIRVEIETNVNLETTPFLVFSSPGWHPGIIGIVASRLVNRYYRPVILISIQDGIGKGSGRSISDYNLYEGLKNNCGPLLISFGGHRFAAGITIEENNIALLASILNEEIKKNPAHVNMQPKTTIDARCSLADIDYNLVSQLELLAPFGNNNPEPVFCADNIRVSSSTVVGNNHLKMSVHSEGSSFDSIWFSKGQFTAILLGSSVSVAFTPQINRWNGGTSLQLKVRDITQKPS